MHKKVIYFILLFIAIHPVYTQEVSRKSKIKANKERPWMQIFEKENFKGMPYRFIPAMDSTKEQKFPLILCFHGMGGRGTDNLKQLRSYLEPFTTDSLRTKYPHYFLAPQTPHIWTNPHDKGDPMPLSEVAKTLTTDHRDVETVQRIFYENPNGELLKAFELVDHLIKTHPIDPKRIYVIGHSMGGFGTWNAIWNRPNFFAAAIPSAGCLFPQYQRKKIAHIPIWAFHGHNDTVVDYDWGKNLFQEMKQVDANMKFTTIQDIGHGAGSYAFKYKGDSKNSSTQLASDQCDPTPDSLAWLFKQRIK